MTAFHWLFFGFFGLTFIFTPSMMNIEKFTFCEVLSSATIDRTNVFKKFTFRIPIPNLDVAKKFPILKSDRIDLWLALDICRQ